MEPGTTAALPTTVDPIPTWCGTLELGGGRPPSGPLRASDGRICEAARFLVRLHGEPLGSLSVPLPADGRPDASAVYRAALDAFAGRIRIHLHGDGLEMVGALGPDAVPARTEVPACPYGVTDPTPVTVVVCTRNRAEAMRTCLEGLRALPHPRLEVVIVDNAPSDDATRRVFEETVGELERFRYVREDAPGLSKARNRGLHAASHDIVAFTDDDVTVDSDWIAGLLRGFRAAEHVACVTGLVCTASLETIAEQYFDVRVDWGVSCAPRLYDLDQHRSADPLYPYSAGRFGTGANFAVRASVMLALGGFDEALGAGTPPAGGEDLDAFVRVVLAGRALAYEPSAIVWHSHRSDLAGLRKQMWGYGTGLTAYLAKHLADGRVRADVLRRVPRGLLRLARIGTETRESYGSEQTLPRGLVAREWAGMVVGPLRYAQARRLAGPAPISRIGGTDPGGTLAANAPDA
ncbi:glycosyltransferase [Frankia sp. CNm7]|uniref:Glycosyltransferase n=1 Tax=Frankia nepalensis TaxID=1836974 RepID=A0A937RHK5_9ACTN|nr:glycosyltransferase [Frankia nepalensis]MBL7498623.1 glycosyltransferase [Frankia nepalensis]MBL7510493.1 glycosyltransferase [Frankia nepalensis]MBL7517168.1 glycosyltransferase [Frankia nepalensis]MBL7630500.1 glycosyltransferase [Frankia nepalensis]